MEEEVKVHSSFITIVIEKILNARLHKMGYKESNIYFRNASVSMMNGSFVLNIDAQAILNKKDLEKIISNAWKEQ